MSAGLHTGIDGAVAHDEARDADLGVPYGLLQLEWVKPVESSRTTEQQLPSAVSSKDGSVAELIALQTALQEVVVGLAALGVQPAQTIYGANPDVAACVFRNQRHAVVGQSIGGVVVFGCGALPGVAVQAVLRAVPHVVLAVGEDAVGEGTDVDAVGVVSVQPTAGRDVQAGQSDGRGHVEPPVVGRECQLGNIVVGDAVDVAVGVGSGQHLVHLETAIGAAADQAAAHGGYPDVAVAVGLEVEHDGILLHVEVVAVVSARRVNVAAAVFVVASPDVALRVFAQGQDGQWQLDHVGGGNWC